MSLGSFDPDMLPYTQLGRKYLTFTLADRDFGINMLYVRGIAGMGEICTVSHLPPFMKGVIHSGRNAAPVVDLRLKLGLPAGEVTGRTCIIMVEIQRRSMRLPYGLLVDAIKEVNTLEDGDLKPGRRGKAGVPEEMILGVADLHGSPKILLNIYQILSSGEVPVVEPTRPGFTARETAR